MNPSSVSGLVQFASNHSFTETVARLERALTEKGVKIFCRIDHSAGAAEAGLRMPPTLLVIFGSARAGTPLMLGAPTLALDLPLKVLIAEDEQGGVWLTGNRAEYLRQRHGIEGDAPALASVEQLLVQVGSLDAAHG